jgi:protein-L-isoaspartate(D-aspartate) O-methyltransferase
MAKIYFLWAALLCCFGSWVLADDVNDSLRKMMVEQQIQARGITDKATLKAMAAVERHRFVDGQISDRAYEDRPLPIGHGQTISQPYIVAFMTEIVQPKPEHRVLEIGAGSGYQAAVLAEIVEKVYTVEIVEPLAESAGKLMKSLGYDNVEVKFADGYYGWPEEAPFDSIVVTAAAEYIPPPLIEQLKDGGRMIIPVGSPLRTQQLMLVEKKDGKVQTRSLMPVRFVPFTRADD